MTLTIPSHRNQKNVSLPSWLLAFDPRKRIFTGRSYYIIKRVMDIFLIFVSSPIWIPLMVIIAILIRITSPDGPIFFLQKRTGKGGIRFKMYKFRTMVRNAEELKEKYSNQNRLMWPDFKITNDPRITKIGNILRKTSLDELPQLFNILKGEMSLVGPRPTSFNVDSYQLWHTERLDVLPGLTGLWQVVARSSIDFDDRLRLDIAYIERCSILLDLVILAQTVLSVLCRKGAM